MDAVPLGAVSNSASSATDTGVDSRRGQSERGEGRGQHLGLTEGGDSGRQGASPQGAGADGSGAGHKRSLHTTAPLAPLARDRQLSRNAASGPMQSARPAWGGPAVAGSTKANASSILESMLEGCYWYLDVHACIHSASLSVRFGPNLRPATASDQMAPPKPRRHRPLCSCGEVPS
ncbi:hypothetical protein COCMIDRAFT_27167 [Bipolaris oryzae ATCC 44560]|uniref:Uncharacterized protein n=1 Tax=Bipolaris oryzae ATCC 44560 TaxID=930090 RepID=W6YYW8_COCMI|nr:uncharacterized protein COCMIDRAFT_27167 [Bipolaris oryzae ATCC 44560]EUC44557.1 hypothetical protein COCMIDRAFT_27167 [Bipolaris oryzae ATCC 44560]